MLRDTDSPAGDREGGRLRQDRTGGLRVRLSVEERQGDGGEERRAGHVVVGEAGQDRECVTTLRATLAHPPAVAEATIEQLEDLDVVARWGHVSVGSDNQCRYLETANLLAVI